jgi:DNA-binding MarR family transcriptional regulator
VVDDTFYNVYVPQVNTPQGGRAPEPSRESVSQIREAAFILARAMGQFRVHERLVRTAGVKLDRAGAALLYVLYTHGDSRVSGLAELLGVDAPTVTRKVQQLERDGLVAREGDAEDRRATRIRLTSGGRHNLERVLKARRAWFDRLLDGWEEPELAAFALLLGRFARSLERDLEEDHRRSS